MKKVILIFILVSIFYLFFNIDSIYLLKEIRFPRYLLVIMVGSTLSVCGFVYQMMLENPIADPYILGISSAAALGSSIAFILGQIILMPIFGFLGSFLTMLIILNIHSFSRIKLILVGVVLNYFIYSLIYILIISFSYDSFGVFNILLGSLDYIFSKKEFIYFLTIFGFFIILLFFLSFYSTKIKILSLGEEVSTSLGLDVIKTRKKLFFLTSILVGVTTSYAGIIGFVGLIVPGGVRLIHGVSHKSIISLNIFYGAIFIMVCDIISTSLVSVKLPIGAITALVGSPIFIYLIVKK